METQHDIELYVDSSNPIQAAKENKIQLEIDNETYYLEVERENHGNQKVSLRWFVLPTLISTLLFWLFFVFRQEIFIPLSGRISIASITLILGLISSFITFGLFFYYGKKRAMPNLDKIYWRNFPTILIAFAVMLLVGLLFAFWILGRLFAGLVLDIYLASLFALILFSVINYATINFILILSPSLMTKFLILIILSGVVISMITNSEAQWWQANISFLGTQEAAYAWQFNLTLILSAFLLVTLIDYLFVVLREVYPNHRGLKILRILLTAMAVCLGLVGYFPSDGPGRSPEFHNEAAGFLVIIVIVIIIGLKWFVPKLSKEFQVMSYIIAVMLATVIYLYLNGDYITLTGFEIIAFFLAFSWLMLLFQNLNQLTLPPVPTYAVTVKYREAENQ